MRKEIEQLKIYSVFSGKEAWICLTEVIVMQGNPSAVEVGWTSGYGARSTRHNCSMTNQKLDWKELPVVCLPLLGVASLNCISAPTPFTIPTPNHILN